MATTEKSGLPPEHHEDHFNDNEAPRLLDRFGCSIHHGHYAQWSEARKLTAKIIGHELFEIALALMVFCGLGLTILDADYKASGTALPAWHKACEDALLAAYSVELVVRVYVLREKLVESVLNIVDTTIVLADIGLFFVGLTDEGIPSVAWLRVLRLMRLLRVCHILQSCPELYLMVQSFMACSRSILWGTCFIGVSIVLFSIAAVEFVHPMASSFEAPITCSRCPDAFSSVWQASITFMETIIVGDTWGDVYIPLLNAHPWTMLLVCPAYLVIHFGFMNIIAASVVDSAQQARVSNDAQLVEMKEKEFQRHKRKLYKMCEEMDLDGGGTLTLAELLNGFENNLQFCHAIKAMDIRQEELSAVFNILDQDGSGDVEYHEFVEQLHKMKSNDSHTMLVFIKHYVTELRKQVNEELSMLKDTIAGGIVELNDKVSQQLELIRSSEERHEKAMEATGKQIERTLEEEKKILQESEELIKRDIAAHSGNGVQASFQQKSIATRAPLPGPPPIGQSFRDSSLQSATAAAVSKLENVVNECRQSITVLANVHSPHQCSRQCPQCAAAVSNLERVVIGFASPLQIIASGNAGSAATYGSSPNGDSGGFLRLGACCTIAKAGNDRLAQG